MSFGTKSLVILNSVDSTNNYAMGVIKEGLALHGNAFFAWEQTHGKGRRGKEWKTEAGKNIMMSIIVKTDVLAIYNQFYLNIAVSLGCLNFFKNYAGTPASIKWPNDIFWNDRKAGGVLIENVIFGNNWQWAVIGIGLNINQTKFNVENVFAPVSLKQITGKDYNIIDLANELYECVLYNYEKIQTHAFKEMFSDYNSHLFGLNKKVKLKKGNIVFETTLKSVSPQGKLITADTLERQFEFDEVKWVL